MTEDDVISRPADAHAELAVGFFGSRYELTTPRTAPADVFHRAIGRGHDKLAGPTALPFREKSPGISKPGTQRSAWVLLRSDTRSSEGR
jgi:hypothetical protein